jgi:hypothetical protein
VELTVSLVFALTAVWTTWVARRWSDRTAAAIAVRWTLGAISL